ncbi:class I SAM-dependent methyltransferase [Leuconostocaceae bacterium ESL0723]|nr:class I SAM-dependent methyltransferase [Leuconostocaceae bacterium ESL0723]
MFKKLKNQGLDAPWTPIYLIIVGILLAILNGISLKSFWNWLGLIVGLLMIVSGVIFIHTSIWGKRTIWQNIVDDLSIPSDSQVLDLGTGHGLVLMDFARQLKAPGQATGIDLWRNRDQSANSQATTENLIKEAGLQDVAHVTTGDMRDLPFDDGQFDFVTASLSIHNVKPAADREKCLQEAVRVLKPGGRLIIADLIFVPTEYVKALKDLNVTLSPVKNTGFNGWWGGPWMSTFELTATKDK